MAMVLKANKKYKVLQLIEVIDKVTRREIYGSIREGAADSEIYDVAQAIQNIKVNPSTININLCGDDFKIVDDSVVNPGGTQTELDDALEYAQEFTLLPGEYKFNPEVKFSGATVKITDRIVYGPNLDGQNRQVKIYYLGYQGNLLAEPKEVPLNGFDEFTAPSLEGKWQYDSTLPELSFNGGSASTKVYKIVKTKV